MFSKIDFSEKVLLAICCMSLLHFDKVSVHIFNSIHLTILFVLMNRQLRSSSRRSNQTIAHHGAFERRFHPRMNSDLDPHTATNGQFSSNSSYTNTSGGFDSGHSPRNHKMDGGKTVNDASGDKGSSEDVLEAETSVPRSTPSLVDDAVPRSNSNNSYI